MAVLVTPQDTAQLASPPMPHAASLCPHTVFTPVNWMTTNSSPHMLVSPHSPRGLHPSSVGGWTNFLPKGMPCLGSCSPPVFVFPPFLRAVSASCPSFFAGLSRPYKSFQKLYFLFFPSYFLLAIIKLLLFLLWELPHEIACCLHVCFIWMYWNEISVYLF